MPTGFDPNQLLRKYYQDVATLKDNDPRAVRLAEELRKAWESAPVVEALNNKIVKLSGFLGDPRRRWEGRLRIPARPILWGVYPRAATAVQSDRAGPYGGQAIQGQTDVPDGRRSPADFEPKPCAMTWRVPPMSSRPRMWSRRPARWRDCVVPLLATLLVGGAGGAQAHPHALVVYSIVLSLPPGGVDRIGFVFTFDPLFSAIILRNAGDGDPDDVLRNHEASLRQLPFEIEIAFNGTRVAMEAPTNLQVSTEGGQITYRFAVPLRGPSAATRDDRHRCR